MASVCESPDKFIRYLSSRLLKFPTKSMMAIGVFILFCSIPMAFASAKDYRWMTGRLVSAGITGHGPVNSGNQNKSSGDSGDTWWTYRISSGDMTHLAVTRESPARIGIALEGPVRFAIDKKNLFVRDGSNSLHSLRLIRSAATKYWR